MQTTPRRNAPRSIRVAYCNSLEEINTLTGDGWEPIPSKSPYSLITRGYTPLQAFDHGFAAREDDPRFVVGARDHGNVAWDDPGLCLTIGWLTGRLLPHPELATQFSSFVEGPGTTMGRSWHGLAVFAERYHWGCLNQIAVQESGEPPYDQLFGAWWMTANRGPEADCGEAVIAGVARWASLLTHPGGPPAYLMQAGEDFLARELRLASAKAEYFKREKKG